MSKEKLDVNPVFGSLYRIGDDEVKHLKKKKKNSTTKELDNLIELCELREKSAFEAALIGLITLPIFLYLMLWT